MEVDGDDIKEVIQKANMYDENTAPVSLDFTFYFKEPLTELLTAFPEACKEIREAFRHTVSIFRHIVSLLILIL